jgi:hypothetical protein
LKSSREAAKWTKIGLFSGLAVWILYLIFIFVLGGAAFFGTATMLQQSQ